MNRSVQDGKVLSATKERGCFFVHTESEGRSQGAACDRNAFGKHGTPQRGQSVMLVSRSD